MHFKLSFLNRCDEMERSIIEEYFQRSFGIDIADAKVVNVKNEVKFIEEFKKSLSATIKSIGKNDNLEINYVKENPSL